MSIDIVYSNSPPVVFKADGLFAKAAIEQDCRKCHGSGRTVSYDHRSRPFAHVCSYCGDLRKKIWLYNQANIPAKYWDVSIDDFDGFSDIDLSEANSYIQNYIQGDSEDNYKGFLIFGDSSEDKTILACALLKELIFKKGLSAKFISFKKLLDSIKKSAYEQGKSEYEILTPLTIADVLLIDDLGKDKGSAWKEDIMFNIVSRRYAGRKMTCFTTSRLHSTQPSANLELLKNRVGETIWSRLHEMTCFIDIKPYNTVVLSMD